MNIHSRAAKITAMLTALVTVIAGMSFASFADSTSGTSDDGSSIASLTELLAADKYTTYALQNAGYGKGKGEVTVKGTDYSAEDTTAVIGDGDGEVHTGTWSDIDTDGNIVSGTEREGLFCPGTGAVGWKVNIPASGNYAVDVVYYPVENNGTASNIERTFYIDGKVPFYEARFLTCTKVWGESYDRSNRDEAYIKDLAGNEIRPDKKETPEWRTMTFSDSSGNNIDPVEVYFEEGEHVIQLEAQREPFAVASIRIYPLEKAQSYEDYVKSHSGREVSGDTISAANDGEKSIKIEGELYTSTSDFSIYPINDRSSAITSPQDPAKQLLNAIGDEKWETTGQWVSWTVNAPKAGLYKIGVRYRQNINDGLFSSRTIRINGKVPFDEARYLQFNYGDEWQSAYLNNGSDEYKDGFLFYLEEGENTIELEVSQGNMASILLRLNEIIKTINSSYLDIRQITGSKPDQYRDYGFYSLIPASIDALAEMSDELYKIVDELVAVNGKSQNVSTLEEIARTLYKMGNREDEVAKNMDTLKSDIGSLGTWLQTAMTQPLAVDYLTVTGADSGDDEKPRAKESFAESLWYEIRMFAVSFVADYNTLGATEEVSEDKSVVVWTSSSRDQATIIRNMINSDFTPNTGISVSLKLVAAGSLLPSILAGVGPDVSLDSVDIINWAIRDAVLPLDGFEGFDELMKEFPECATVPLTLYTDDIKGYNREKDGPITDDSEHLTSHVYGLPMTMDFPMMFYRADVFQQQGLSVPKTWEDFYAVLPILQNNQMEVIIPGSTGGTYMFLYQMQPKGTSVRDGLYQDNGRRIGLDTNIALESFDRLCNLFTQYSLPITADFVNRFRTGEVPLAITNYSAYTQLSLYAPEIKGLWEFVPIPGWARADGTINNTSIATVTSIVMPRGNRSEEKANNAWQFMKWYAGHNNQSRYANEYTALFGQQSKYTTANKIALEALPWTTQEKNNIQAQMENTQAVPDYPGSYIITRYVEFAFLAAYNDNVDPVTSMLNYITDINKEISRKRKEFDLDAYEISYSSNFTESQN